MMAALFRFDPNARAFCWVRGIGAPASAFGRELSGASYKMGQETGLIGLVGARAKPLYLPDVSRDARWSAHDFEVGSCYLTPLVSQGHTLGVLALFDAQRDAFSEAHRALADAFAQEMALIWQLCSDTRATCTPCAISPDGCALAQALYRRMEGCEASLIPPPRGRTLDFSSLSARELEVVQALRRGLRLSDVARVLDISHHTARNHLKHVFKKLDVHSQVELLSIMSDLAVS